MEASGILPARPPRERLITVRLRERARRIRRPGEYFSTGLTEDIVTQLSKIPDLEVASSMSSLRYRNTDKGLREIGRESRKVSKS